MSRQIFSGQPFRDIISNIHFEITRTIENLERDYILKVSESDLINTLNEKYAFTPITLLSEEKTIEILDADIPTSDYPDRFLFADGIRLHYVSGTEYIIYIPYEGDSDLFLYQASTSWHSPPEGRFTKDKLFISIKFLPYSSKEEEILNEVSKRIKSEIMKIEKNIGWINKEANEFNTDLPHFIQSQIQGRKEKIIISERIVAALNIPIKKSGISKTLEIPDIKQKIILKLPDVGNEKFEPEPTISEENYNSILKIIQNMIIAMERSPQTFSKLKEEELRDFILVNLNGIFEGSATGETFNGHGKTDILIRNEGKNIFIAECKFWKGSKSITGAIDQLLSYASWRDTKTAIIIFNKTKDFTEVLNKIEISVSQHKNYKKMLQKTNISNMRFLFHHNDDKNKELILTILAFEIPDKDITSNSLQN